MTTESLDGRAMRERIAALRAAVAARPEIELGPDGCPIAAAGADAGRSRRRRPATTGRAPSRRTRRGCRREPASSGPAASRGGRCDRRQPDPGSRVQLRRDRHRHRRGRPADPRQRRGEPGGDARGVGRDRARGRGAGPSALDRARPGRGLGRGRRELGRHRGRGGDRGPGSGRLAAGRHQLRQDAGLRPRQAARPGQPPRGPPLRGLAGRRDARRGRAALPARGADRLGRAHVPGRDARPPASTGCWARPSTTRPARRSTRSAGCSACRIRAGPRS